MQTVETSQHALCLHQNGQHVSIDDEVLQTLGDLTGRCLVASEDAEHGYDVQPSRRSLIFSSEGRRIPNAGCLPLLNRRAIECGIDLSVCATPPITQLPRPRNIAYLDFPQLAQFVYESERGLIQRPVAIPLEELIYDLSLAFPDQRLVVLGSHVRQLDRIHNLLATKIEDIQSVHARRPIVVNEDDPMPRIVLSTFTEAAVVDLATSDIVLLLDAYHCTQERAKLAIATMDGRFRLFGLTTTGRKVSPSETDMAKAVFGPELLEVSSRGRSRRKAHVAWLPSHKPRIDLTEDAPRFWSKCYWHNDRRNRSIKQLAEGLASGRMPQARKFRQVGEWVRHAGKTRFSITILVQQLQHALVLAKLLPDWDIVTGDMSLKGCPGSFRNRIKQQRRRWMTGQRQIVLADAVRQFRGETSDVVIRAGGGKFADAIPDSWLHTDEGSNKPLLVVDLEDFHNGTTRRWTGRRGRGYYNRNIFPPGVSIGQGRTAMFLYQQRRNERDAG